MKKKSSFSARGKRADIGDLVMLNGNREAADVILFGGEPYQEPIVAEGPFVMHSMLEIADAYRDFHSGKYGKIDYEKQKPKASKKLSSAGPRLKQVMRVYSAAEPAAPKYP